MTLWLSSPLRHSLIWFHTGFYLLSVICDLVIFLNSKSLKLYLDEDLEKPVTEKNGAAANGVELDQKPSLMDK